MAATLIDGKAIAAGIRAEIARAVADQIAAGGERPGLGVLLVGDNPASLSYVTGKEKACSEAGMRSIEHRLPAIASTEDVLQVIAEMNADARIHGVLVQLPLPGPVDENRVIDAIAPEKDVDGFTAGNVGRMMLGRPCFLPCTPNAILRLLDHSGIETDGRHVVVVGRSNIVGKPIAQLLARKRPGPNATVTMCHTGTRDLGAFTRQADILVVATGRPRTITADMVKPGAAVIDVGVNRIPNPTKKAGFHLEGDVDFAAVKEVAGWITPVPGGVGPMTITMLLLNTLEAARRTS
ncbi:MAG: bifunctional 5,10-methylenetetrahydrofolate dehydrogenase/5,10-methenyltetrahydrofolate cyclohydrolase [Kiritimatiellia bacterium]|jgi:methylenetetrahydrofolate dehydrogenase (NADP+)/methenyltetrahydrofolate cyclohydrolase